MDIQTLYTHFLQHRVICTDTRKITPGCIFFALKGEHFDGNQFANDALLQGASLAVVSDPKLKGDRFFRTADTLETLQALANYHRRQIKVPIIAITGSNGKTTTKELITTVLSTSFKVSATAGNFNNHIGVPLTLLSVPDSAEIIVCEMGANHPGEIKFLCEIAEPTHGVITNIGKAHLEGFGSIEGVMATKGQLFEYLRDHNGHAFVNIDDNRVKQLGDKLNRKTTYSLEPNASADIYLSYRNNEGEAGFSLVNETNNVHIHSKMFGRYNASNMLAAYTIGLHFGIAQDKLTSSLSDFVSKSNRSEDVSVNGCSFIMDAYNANPSSMELAIRAFAEKHPSGRVILGDMKELGGVSLESHCQIVSLVERMGFEKIYLIGDQFIQALSSTDVNDPRIMSYQTIDDLQKVWNWSACQGQTIFVKGSRSMQLEKILQTTN
jgi:UDP-N-acetylmuramoyl-tripeptide--D-alanyl-D-alanine ligase